MIKQLLNGQTAIGTGASYTMGYAPTRTFHAVVTGTGALTATVAIEVSNDGVNWIGPSNPQNPTSLGTISLSGTPANGQSPCDGFSTNASWAYVRANLTAISGTNAAVTVTMGA